MVTTFNKKCHNILVPDKNLSLDESMMLWRGKLVFKQHIKNKRHRYGIKFCEPTANDGYVLKISSYLSKIESDDNDLGKTAAVFISLIDNCLDKGYHVFAENYYNSFYLANHLTGRKTYLYGKLRKDRKGNQKSIMDTNLRRVSCYGNHEKTW